MTLLLLHRYANRVVFPRSPPSHAVCTISESMGCGAIENYIVIRHLLILLMN